MPRWVTSLTARESPFPGKWTAADERQLPKLLALGTADSQNRRSCPVGRQTGSDASGLADCCRTPISSVLYFLTRWLTGHLRKLDCPPSSADDLALGLAAYRRIRVTATAATTNFTSHPRE